MAEIYTHTWPVDCTNPTYGTNAFTYRIRVNENSTDTPTNKHNITVYFDIIGVRSYYHDLAPTTNTFTITTNGSPASVSADSNISGAKSTNYSSWTAVGSWTGDIIGNNDGTLTLSVSIRYGISGKDYTPVVKTVSTGTIYATTLPRASDLSLGSSSITISSTSGSLSYSITAKSNSFYNRLVWSVAGSADTVVPKSSGSSTGSISYSDIINKMPSASSGKLLAVVKTYSDSGYSNLIGTSSEASCDITLDTSQSVFKPTVTLGNIAINTTPTNISVAVAGYSTLKATFNSSAGSGSTIDAVYFTSSNGSLNMSASTSASGTITSKTLPANSSSYTFTLNAYAIDKRGSVSDTVTKTYTVRGYAPPSITLKAYRVAANVSSSPYPQDNAGGYVWISFTNTVALSGYGNAATSATCKYKRSTDSSWTTLSTNPTGTNASSNPNPTLVTTSSMTVTYTVQDRISSNEVTINVGTARYAFDLYDDKSNVGVGLGTTAEAGYVKSSLPIKTSFKNSIATGSYGAAANDVSRLCNELRFSSGCMGSVNITTALTANSVTIGTGWYNYIYSPHRSGGISGAATGDNCGYGTLILSGMNNSRGTFTLRIQSSSPYYERVNRVYTTEWGPSNDKTNLVNLIYPVGSIYMSVNSTSPATLFGGTWVQLKDRFLLGAGDTYSNGGTGGEATHTLTTSEMPSHTHDVEDTTGQAKSEAYNGSGSRSWELLDIGNANGTNRALRARATGGGQAHNNMPPYLAVYMWKRTA